MDYPFFFYQPWPFFISVVGLVIGLIGFFSSFIAWRAVKRMKALLETERSRNRPQT